MVPVAQPRQALREITEENHRLTYANQEGEQSNERLMAALSSMRAMAENQSVAAPSAAPPLPPPPAPAPAVEAAAAVAAVASAAAAAAAVATVEGRAAEAAVLQAELLESDKVGGRSGQLGIAPQAQWGVLARFSGICRRHSGNAHGTCPRASSFQGYYTEATPNMWPTGTILGAAAQSAGHRR